MCRGMSIFEENHIYYDIIFISLRKTGKDHLR